MNIYEQFLDDKLKRLFKYKFEYAIRPEWLTNPETGYRLEIDFYSKEGNIAIELNGWHHYWPKYQKDLEYRRYLDRIKRKIIQAKKIRYLCIPMEIVIKSMKNKRKFTDYLVKSNQFRVSNGYFV